jgi:DNA-binding LacI/PurR family transcriptional regulator
MGAERLANEFGYLLNIVHISEEELQNYLSEVKEKRTVSGIVLFASELPDDLCSALEKSGIPLVVVDNAMKFYSVNSVCPDNESGTYQAVSYLAGLGHKKIGLLAPFSPMGGLPKREKSFYETMELLNLPVDPGHVAKIDHVFDVGIAQMDQYLATAPDLPTAFYAVNDVIAAAAMQSLKKHGYRIPDDISIVGFDDANVGNFSVPRITTMKVNRSMLGELAVDRLDKIINGDKTVLHITMETPLIVKESTKRLVE